MNRGARQIVDGSRGRTDWLAPADPGRAIAGRIAEVFAEADRKRMAELDRVCKLGGRCMFCGGTVPDAALAVHPGCCATCGKRAENRAAALERFGPPVAAEPFTEGSSPPAHPAPAITEERAMASSVHRCSKCGKDGHNARSCGKVEEAKPEPVKVAMHKGEIVPPPERLARPLSALTVDQLISDRARGMAEVARVVQEQNERARAIDDELRRRRDEIRKALGEDGEERASA